MFCKLWLQHILYMRKAMGENISKDEVGYNFYSLTQVS